MLANMIVRNNDNTTRNVCEINTRPVSLAIYRIIAITKT